SKYEEPFGRVLIEGYRQRAIIVSSNKGALPELNVNKDLILSEVTPDEIAQKITNIFKNHYDLSVYEEYSERFSSNLESYQKMIGVNIND
ncbi:MAG: hypothetical protein LBV67_04405, partial [Streptococcaceae bacterium]|nr:hypothetical protein [Streptococcaceae bacterium]